MNCIYCKRNWSFVFSVLYPVMQVSMPQHTSPHIKYLSCSFSFFSSSIHWLWQRGGKKKERKKKKRKEKATQVLKPGFTLKSNKTNNPHTTTETHLSLWAIISCYLPTILCLQKPAQAKLYTINTCPTIINHQQKGTKLSEPDKKSVQLWIKGWKKERG